METPIDLTHNEGIKALLQSRKGIDNGNNRENTGEEEHTTSTEEGNNIGYGSTSNAPTQVEEQTSSFFDIIIKPISLAVLFIGGFISWLFLSNTGKTEEHIQQPYDPLVELNSCDHDSQNDFHLF